MSSNQPYGIDQVPEYRPSVEEHAATPERRPADTQDEAVEEGADDLDDAA